MLKVRAVGKFDEYFLMTEADVAEYALGKLPGLGWDAPSTKAREITVGGLANHVFRVRDAAAHSVIIKQAGPSLRSLETLKVSTDRNRKEVEILRLEGAYAPGLVPRAYFYDTVMAASAMEDLSGHQVLRQALVKGETFPNYANDITTFMVNNLLMTSDVVMGHKEKRALAGRFISPDTSQVIEELEMTDPYTNFRGENAVSPPNMAFMERELYGDARLRLAAAQLKFKFMTCAQALVHGDLHSDNVFVTRNSTKAFDPEYATYAPMGLDLGNVAAHLVFAYGHGLGVGDERLRAWALDMLEQAIDLFSVKFRRKFDREATETMAKVPGFKEWYLGGVLADAAGYAGVYLHGRTVGPAKVADVTAIGDPAQRAWVERLLILCGKDLILNQGRFRAGADFLAAVKRAEAGARGA